MAAAGNAFMELPGVWRGGAAGVPDPALGPALPMAAGKVLSVVLVTDNLPFVERLRRALSNGSLDLVAAGACDDDLPLQRLRSAVVVIDAALLDSGRVGAASLRRIAFEEARLMLAVERIQACAVALSLQSRARGCIEFDVAPDAFRRAVEAVARGEFWFPRWMMDQLYTLALPPADKGAAAASPVAAAVGADLTTREAEVLSLVRLGLTNKQIAQELSISPSTVKKHLHNALSKHGIQRRRQLYR